MLGATRFVMRQEPRRVLVVKLSSLGDIVHVTPCLRALRHAWPRAEIVMAVEHRFADLVRHSPYLDGLVEVDPPLRTTWAIWQQARRALGPFRKVPFDLAIDFQGNRRSALWIYASGAAVKAGRGGWRPGWQVSVARDPGHHAVEVCASIAKAIGIAVDDLSPEITVSSSDAGRICDLLRPHGLGDRDLFLAHPFSRWRSKEWPLARYVETLRAIRPPNGRPWVVTGGPDDEERAGALIAALPAGTAISLAGRLTVGELLCLLRRGKFLLTGDTGPMHAAAAFGVTVVALFGPTWPERTGPRGTGHMVIQARRPPSHHTYTVDREGSYMAAIEVGPVVDAIRSFLGDRPREQTS
jgi:ADP-heptose:LPS heptosyltransferase